MENAPTDRLIYSDSKGRDDHHLPERHQPRSQTFVAMQVVMETAVEPAPVNQQKHKGMIEKTACTDIRGKVMCNPCNGNHMHQVIKKFQTTHPAFFHRPVEFSGRSLPS